MSDPNDYNAPIDSPVVIDPQTVDFGSREPGFITRGPLLTPKRFKKKYLFGIPLKAALTDDELDLDDLKDFLRDAVAECENQVRIPISPVRITDKFDYERADDMQFGTRRLTRWPLLQVEKLAVLYPGRTPGEEAMFPTSWVEPDGNTGMIRFVPRSGADMQQDLNFTAAQFGFHGILAGNLKSWPDMWNVTYLAGFQADAIPDALNDLIGIMAAIKVLSILGPATMPYNSYSVGIDGLSQGAGNAGSSWLGQRMQELMQERDRKIAECRAHWGTDIILAAF
jgi:hypothetical protein